MFRNTCDSTSAIVIGGLLMGTWRRTLHRRRVNVEIVEYHDLGARKRQLIEDATGRYGEFIGLPVEISYR